MEWSKWKHGRGVPTMATTKGEVLCNQPPSHLSNLTWNALKTMPTNLEHLNRPLRATSHTSRDHEIVRAHKKVSKGRPNTPPTSYSVVTDPQVSCEVTCD